MRALLLATTNRHKLDEYRAIFTDLQFKLYSLRDIQLDLDVEETGTTFRENAELKALAYVHASDMLSLADDSGLEIDALGGAPGVYSAPGLGLQGMNDQGINPLAWALANGQMPQIDPNFGGGGGGLSDLFG